MDRNAALYDTFILMLVTVVLALQRAKLLCRSPHCDFYQGFLFGCLLNLFFDEYRVQKWYRDAKILELSEGTREAEIMTIGRMLQG